MQFPIHLWKWGRIVVATTVTLATAPAFALAFALIFAGCVPIGEGTPVSLTVEGGDDAEITAGLRGRTLLVEVRDPSGVGSATLSFLADPQPRDLILRLHLDALEQMSFAYEGATVRLSVTGPDNLVAEEVVLPGEPPRTLTASSPWWMDVGVLADGAFDVRAPRAFVEAAATGRVSSFTLSWADFLR